MVSFLLSLYLCQDQLNHETETLRRSAENTMHALVRTVFSRLHHLDPEAEEARLQVGDDVIPEGEIRMTVPAAEPPVEEGDTDSQEVTLGNHSLVTLVPEVTLENHSEVILVPQPAVMPHNDRPQCTVFWHLYNSE